MGFNRIKHSKWAVFYLLNILQHILKFNIFLNTFVKSNIFFNVYLPVSGDKVRYVFLAAH